jgi:hypothetical protein
MSRYLSRVAAHRLGDSKLADGINDTIDDFGRHG